MDPQNQRVTIPSTLFEVYRQYKASTVTVLNWLSENGATPQLGINVAQLQEAAESVRDINVPVPDGIRHSFRDSVVKRKRVTHWFTSAELNSDGKRSKTTENHVHFTEKLQEAFSTLCPGREGSSSHPVGKDDVENVTNETRNRFGVLEDLEPDPTQVLDSFPKEEADAVPLQSSSPKNTPVLEDDPFDALIRIHLVLRELDAICELVKLFWEQVSAGTLPLLFASWLTNSAYDAAKRVCATIMDIDPDAQTHQEVYIGVVNQLGIVFERCPIESQYGDFTRSSGMTFPWFSISHLKVEIELGKSKKAITSNHRQNPNEYICPAYIYGEDGGNHDSFKKDIETYKAVLYSMTRLLQEEQNGIPKQGFTSSDMNPLIADLSTFLASDKDHPPLSLVFGLHLLLETYRSFIWKNSQTPIKANCRLKALQFASQVKDMVQAPLLQSRDSIVYRMQIADAAYLNTYLAEKCFDLYYQCPWTAGFHMCEILHHSIDAGMRLFNSEGRVGAVLHMYNALRQIKIIDATPLLDDLCKAFHREIFLGILPTENFSSHFRRYLGGNVHVESRDMSSNARQDRRSIGLPARLPSGQSENRRLVPAETSLFYKLYNDRFAPTLDFWSRLYIGKINTSVPKSQLDTILNQLYYEPFTAPLAKMKEVVLDEMTGRLPVAAIKYHNIYALCVQMLKDMAVLMLRQVGGSIEDASPDVGFGFVETLLVSIVDHQRSAQMAKMLPQLASLYISREVIMDACYGKTLDDFVWKF